VIAFHAVIGSYSFHMSGVSGNFAACKIFVTKCRPIRNASQDFHFPGYFHNSKILDGRFEILLNFGGLFEGSFITNPAE